MKLSEIDTSVWYPVTIPSSKQVTKFRPFRVREERSLLTAQESEDQSTMLSTLEEIVRSCVKDIKHNLTIFDVEYLFVQIRSKSVGEFADIIAKCKKCDANNSLTVNLGDVVLSAELTDGLVKISDIFQVKMRYPSIQDIDKKLDEHSAIASCIETVYFENAVFHVSEGDLEEIKEFLNNRTEDEMDKILGFIESIPTVKLDIQFVCKECGEKNEIEMKSISDFF